MKPVERVKQIETTLSEKNFITDEDLDFIIEKYEEYEQYAVYAKDNPLVFYIRIKLDSLFHCREYRTNR